jgi:uncharacterized coiled-coil protein SlyX
MRRIAYTSWWVAALPLVVVLGCSASPSYQETAAVSESAGEPDEILMGEGDSEPSSKAQRQIIYRATLVLNVQNFADTERKIAALVKTTGGFVAQFREDRPYGAQRGGHWTVRIPVDQFQSFVDQAGRLGVAESREVQSEDVTEEYVDLTARLKNKQQLEARLLELVAKRSDEIKDVIALEAELSRVREEIERMQGRLRYLNDRVQLTTVDITAHERLDFRPPESTLSGRVAQTLAVSLENLKLVGEGLLLALVALAPWLAVLAILMVPLILLLRRWRRRRRNSVVTAEAVSLQ